MNTKIQAVGFNADQKLIDFIELKSSKLLTFHDKIIDTDVNLKLDSHQKIKDKVVNIKCNIPNATLFAENSAKSFEEAVDNALDDIRRQIEKKKQQNIAKGSPPLDELNTPMENYEFEDDI